MSCTSSLLQALASQIPNTRCGAFCICVWRLQCIPNRGAGIPRECAEQGPCQACQSVLCEGKWGFCEFSSESAGPPSGPSSAQNSTGAVRTGAGWERPDVFPARAENTIHPRNTLLSNKSTKREERGESEWGQGGRWQEEEAPGGEEGGEGSAEGQGPK